MGTRYYLTIVCPDCGFTDDDGYYAPTCGFTTWECECGHVVDLEEYTGISYEEASNLAEMQALVDRIAEEYTDDQEDQL